LAAMARLVHNALPFPMRGADGHVLGARRPRHGQQAALAPERQSRNDDQTNPLIRPGPSAVDPPQDEDGDRPMEHPYGPSQKICNVGQVANLPKTRQIGNLPHVGMLHIYCDGP